MSFAHKILVDCLEHVTVFYLNLQGLLSLIHPVLLSFFESLCPLKVLNIVEESGAELAFRILLSYEVKVQLGLLSRHTKRIISIKNRDEHLSVALGV